MLRFDYPATRCRITEKKTPLYRWDNLQTGTLKRPGFVETYGGQETWTEYERNDKTHKSVRLTLVRGFLNRLMPASHSTLTANSESPLQTQMLNAVQRINCCFFVSQKHTEPINANALAKCSIADYDSSLTVIIKTQARLREKSYILSTISGFIRIRLITMGTNSSL